MANLTINGANFAPFPTAFVNGIPTDGSYYGVAPFGVPPRESAPNYREIDTEFIGIPGITKTRLYPFGPITIWAQIVIVGTKAGTETARNSMMASFAQQARYTIALPSGPSRQGCKLMSGSGKVTNQWQIGGKVAILVEFEFQQLSPTN